MGLNPVLFLLALFALLSSVPPVRSLNTDVYLDQINHNNELRQFYLPFYNQTLDLINIVFDDELRSIDAACANSLIQLRNGLVHFEEWAIKCM